MDIRRTINVTAANPVLGDIDMSAAHDLVWTDDVTGESTAQRLRIRFAFWLGEYFGDLRQGVPYLKILGEKPDEAVVSAIWRSVILGTPGIVALTLFAPAFDHATRTASLAFTAQLENGKTFDTADFGPFLVEY